MALIKKDIEDMTKEDLIICQRCKRSPIRILKKYEIEYDKNGFAKCFFCNKNLNLQIISKKDLINKIDRQTKNLIEKKERGWKNNQIF